MISIYSISLGCPKNLVDTERTLGALQHITPVKIATSLVKADFVFINTCGFITPAIEESVRTLVETIDEINSLPKNKRPLLVVAGCLVGRFGIKALRPDLPEVNLFLDNREIGTWDEQLRELLKLHGPAVMPVQGSMRMLSTGSYAWLKISEGCQHKCAFCSIPLIRGHLCSTPIEKLQLEAKNLLSTQVKELIIVAQDITAWGKDFAPKQNLHNLLEPLIKLVRSSDVQWLRLMYMYPSGLTDDLLSFLRDVGSPFIPYFDIPVQHAAKDVLNRMGRPFAENPRKALDKVRSYFPDAALRTSIITGFPGETEQDFEELCKFIQEVRFHHLGVFTYHAEEGTPAASMEGQIEQDEKQRRYNKLMAIQSEISAEIMEGYVGETLEVLVDAPHPEWPGLHVGRTWFQAPEVDGTTYISGEHVAPGKMLKAEITEASTYDLSSLV